MSQIQTSPNPARPGGMAPTPPDLLVAWPRTAQWALGFLLALAAVLIALQSFLTTRRSARPTELERGAALVGRIDLNRADRVQLELLPDIGPNLARNIEEYRRAKGSFRSVDELKNVSGIGDARLGTLRPWVYVENEEEAPAPARAESSRPDKGANLTRPVDVNRAGEEELQRLPGIGPTLARRIVEARRVAPFRSVDDLRRVRGIGVKTLEKLRPCVLVGSKPKGAV